MVAKDGVRVQETARKSESGNKEERRKMRLLSLFI